MSFLYFVLLPVAIPVYFSWLTYRGVQSTKTAALAGDLEATSDHLLSLQKNISYLDRYFSNLGWLCRLLGQADRCGTMQPFLPAAGFAVEGGYLSVQAVREGEALFTTIQSASPPLGGEQDLEVRDMVVEHINGILVDYKSAEKSLSLARAGLEQVDFEQLPFGLTSLGKEVWQKLILSEEILSKVDSLLEQLPHLVGLSGKQTYLILLQNSSELRPTGGFIGSYAIFTLDAGKLTQLKVDDIYNPDGLLQNTEPAPAPIQQHLGVDNLGIRDANWWHDFPTSAAKIISLYQQATTEQVDVVIGLNLNTIQSLLEKIGPLNLADSYQETITAENLFEKAELYSEVGFEPGSDQKKRFLTALSQELITKLLNTQKAELFWAMGVLGQSLENDDVMLYSVASELQDVFDQRDWSCRVPEATVEEDHLAIIDANVGGNKANFWIDRSSNYRLDVDRQGNLTGVLTVSWVHRGTSGTWPGGDYKNFLRVYAPKYANLKETSGFSTEVQRYEEFDKKVFAGLVEVPVNTTKEVILKYNLPPESGFAAKDTYKLYIERQAGMVSEPFTLTVNLPVFLTAKEVSAGTIDQQGGRVVWQTRLDRDQQIEFVVER